MSESAQPRLGFIGLGVMGEPICRNLVQKSGAPVVAFDKRNEPLSRLTDHGVEAASSIKEVMAGADIVFMSLPSGEVVKEVAEQPGGLLACVRPGQIIVDLSTSSVSVTRALARKFGEQDAVLVDAPVARTREAAERGELSVMVGADPKVYQLLFPLISTFATDVTLCGAVGCGQLVKIINNYLLFVQVASLSRVKRIGEVSGIEASVLFEALSKGSADSFALRSHGMKAVLPGRFPENTFSVRYAMKDLKYALQLASDAEVVDKWGQEIEEMFDQAIARGWGEQYWPVISKLF